MGKRAYGYLVPVGMLLVCAFMCGYTTCLDHTAQAAEVTTDGNLSFDGDVVATNGDGEDVTEYFKANFAQTTTLVPGHGVSYGQVTVSPGSSELSVATPPRAVIGQEAMVVHFRDQHVIDRVEINAANGEFILVPKAEWEELKQFRAERLPNLNVGARNDSN